MFKSIIVIPCYNVKNKILHVTQKIDLDKVYKVIIVDDFCPQKTGNFVKKKLKNKKFKIIFSKKNLGVGGAFILGLKFAKKFKPDQIIKIDGDGQHDPKYLDQFILNQKKYPHIMFKGKRVTNFFKSKIPFKRYIGNILITYIIRIITKNFFLNDVVNGFLSLPKKIFNKINFKEISNDFFFEQDLIINVSRKKFLIKEIMISTKYSKNQSNLNEFKVIFPFLKKYFLILFGFR